MHNGEARIAVAFTVDELLAIALCTDNENVRRRALCAIGLLDADTQAEAQETLEEAGLLPR